ncbi:MAG: hypothetical protein IM507_11040 [Microcystis sp. M20BS1]|uniref:hypothetical protein n=1 Tax=Microcystis sp. M20BS1 TaxID=2771181 RepID=UPI00257F404E|nr:hypothetical protein [Microcystis sp. M20BS1]MCA2632890.1 hypothetical protein [Microcystis sp. M20BS1]
MKLRIKLTRTNATRQVTLTTSPKNGNTVLTGTVVGASDYQLNVNGNLVDVSELAIGLTVNLVFRPQDTDTIAEHVADGYRIHGNGSPFITMVIECQTKKPAAGGNIIIMGDDIASIDYEAWNDDTFVNEKELDMLFQKGAGTKGASGAAREASAPTSGAPNWFSRKVTLQERL